MIKKTLMAIVGCTLLTAGVATAGDAMMQDKDMMMKSMDSNADGKVSKDEYMAYYEKKWMGMQKDSSGMVDSKSMMMKDPGMMKGKPMSDDSMSH